MTFIGKGGMDEILSFLTEAAGCFKLQGACFAGNRLYFWESLFCVIGF